MVDKKNGDGVHSVSTKQCIQDDYKLHCRYHDRDVACAMSLHSMFQTNSLSLQISEIADRCNANESHVLNKGCFDRITLIVIFVGVGYSDIWPYWFHYHC